MSTPTAGLLGSGEGILPPASASGYSGLGRAEAPGRLLTRLMKWIQERRTGGQEMALVTFLSVTSSPPSA